MDVNQVIYTIAKKVDLYQFSLDHSDRSAHTIAPLFQKEFGNNYRLLKEAIIKIEKNDLIPGLTFTDYPGSSTIVGLDVTNAVMSEYAARLANTMTNTRMNNFWQLFKEVNFIQFKTGLPLYHYSKEEELK